MKLRLYTDESAFASDPVNQGLKEAEELIAILRGKGVEVKRIDTSQLSDKDIQEAYMEAVSLSVCQKFGIRQIFGSRRKSASCFGKGVPALFVYEHDSEHPIDVYPHQGLNRVITIRDFLASLVEKGQVASSGAS
jgi:hypothetical protein